MPLPFTPRQRTAEDKIIYFTSPVNLPSLNLGDFTVQTNGSGALTVQPKDQVVSEPSFIAKPVSIGSDISGIFLIDSAETGGRINLEDLINKLIDIPISVGNVEMPIRSLFGQLFTRVAAEEAAISDISGIRIPAIVTEQLSNAALDGAREAAQALKDAAQDASGVLFQLAQASAATDISGVAARVSALEATPGFDASALEARVTAAEAAIGEKAAAADVNAALDLKASAMSVYVLDVRLSAEEQATTAAGTRLDAVEAALPGKVSQGDYDVYVAANDAAVAAAAGAAATAQAAADAAAATANAAEVAGYAHKLVVEEISTAGISGAYWAETIGGVIVAAADAGKLVNYVFDAPAGEIVLPVGTPAAGAFRRLRNGNASGVLAVSLGGESYEIVAGETMAFQYNGSAWRLI